MSLRHSYTLFAPVYDLLVANATRRMRRDSLAGLGAVTGRPVLLLGVGTGLDLPLLPPGARYFGLDLTPAMLRRARRRVPEALEVHFQCGDAQRLPYRDEAFEAVVLHLILAVVPDPRRLLAEAARVTRPGGRLLVVDKFLRPGQRAPLRRALTPLAGRLATRMDVVLETLLADRPELRCEADAPALAGGWFRRVRLRKTQGETADGER